MKLPILCSTSGGRTSAFMSLWLKNRHPDREIVYVFANTGKEKEETLIFLDRCDKEWGLNIVWIEVVVNPVKGQGNSFQIVDFKTANRNGKPFNDVIKKYGIPNKDFPHCTRELKIRPIKKYMKSLGYSDWETAIGYRADEPTRSSKEAVNPIYPLRGEIMVDKKFIRNWWDQQPFDLQLQEHEGNCDLCWKKSKRKRMTLISDMISSGNTNSLSQWIDWENGDEYIFDRDGFSLPELVEMSKKPFKKFVDTHGITKDMFDPILDAEHKCGCMI